MKVLKYILIAIGLGLVYCLIKYLILGHGKANNALTKYLEKKANESKHKIIKIDEKIMELNKKKAVESDFKNYTHNQLVHAIRDKLTGSNDK